MLRYAIRRLLFAIPTLLAISFVVFALLDLAPGDPTAQLPLTIPPEVREQIRQSLGIGQPFPVRYLRWLQQFLVNEPLNLLEAVLGAEIGDSGARLRVRSWATRSPVVDLIAQRLPQTLTVVGVSYLVAVLIAVPVGVLSAYRQHSIFDRLGTVVTMVGFSVPTFFTGTVLIVIFSAMLGWLPSIYDTTHRVTDLDSLVYQVKQMIMPVMVLALFNAAQISRFTRSAVLDSIHQEYVRTARAQGAHRTGRDPHSRAAQQHDPGGHRDRAGHPVDLRGGGYHRADLPHQRHRRAADRGDRGCGHPDGADRDLHLRGADRDVQSGRGPAVRRAGSTDPL